ncbi:hypothetical protein R70241_04421 [Paraburkholderia saeva]|nr:hypothetical protein R70241_04421 [Paraburkholderia saeva]
MSAWTFPSKPRYNLYLLNVRPEDQPVVRAFGARFDRIARRWIVPCDRDLVLLGPWLQPRATQHQRAMWDEQEYRDCMAAYDASMVVYEEYIGRVRCGG